MEYRNARYSTLHANNSVDCEINHPIHGWIETTIPLDDSDPSTQEIRDLILSEKSSNDLAVKLLDGLLVPISGAEKAAAVAAKAAEDARRQADESAKAGKLAGVEFEGVMCSATKEDMWGLASVKDWVRAGSSTNFNFDNGNTLTLTPQNIDAFEAVWIPFRASFFQ